MFFDPITHIFYSPRDGGDYDPNGPSGSEPEVSGPTDDPAEENDPSEVPAETGIVPKTRREKFLAKIAGDEIDISPKSRREKFLNKIANSSGSGSGGGSGGSAVMLVEFAPEEEYAAIMADRSVAEIITAYQAGASVRGHFSADNAERYFELYAFGEDFAAFYMLPDETGLGTATLLYCEVSNNDEGDPELWSVVESMDFLPVPDQYDDGKFLGISNGSWTKVALVGFPGVTNSDNNKIMKVQMGSWQLVDPILKIKNTNGTLDTKYSAIEGAFETGRICMITTDHGTNPGLVVNIYQVEDDGYYDYFVNAYVNGVLKTWKIANTKNGYPTLVS